MGLFSIFKRNVPNDNRMPIGAALDMLESVSKRFPHLVIEWIAANPMRAKMVAGLVNEELVAPFKRAGWDGPYSITQRNKFLGDRITNMFFQDLRRDVSSLVKIVTEVGERENSAIKWLLAMNAPRQFSDDALADEILKRGVRSTKESALEFVQDTYIAAQSGLFDDLLSNSENAEDDKFVGLLINNVSALKRMSGWAKISGNIQCTDEEQESVLAACIMSYVTTMLNTVDFFNVINDKDSFYAKTHDAFPLLRPLFNECLGFYEQIPHPFLEQLTADVEQDQKLNFALLYGCRTWCLLRLEKKTDPGSIRSSPELLQFACVATYTACKEMYGIK